MHAPRHQHHDLLPAIPPLLRRNIPAPPHRLLDTPHHLHRSRGIDPAPRVRQTPLHLQPLDDGGAGVHAHEVGPEPFVFERGVGAEHGVREGPLVAEGGRQRGVEGDGEGVGVAGLLVEEEDARAAPGAGLGLGRRKRRGDLGREPQARELDALERVAAVDVPRDVFLAAGFAAAGPAHLFEAGDEFGREPVVALAVWRADGREVGFRDGDGEAGVGFLEVGGQAELDGLERGVSVDDVEIGGDRVRALAEDVDGGGRLRGCIARSARFHDSTFMPGDFFYGVPQQSRVIDPQTRNAGDGRPDKDVRAVVFSANAAFNYCSIDALAHVGMVCHQRQEPEVRRLRHCIWRLPFRPRCIL